MVGTEDYISPEVLSEDIVTPAADYWSLGVVIYMLLTAKSPFKGKTDF